MLEEYNLEDHSAALLPGSILDTSVFTLRVRVGFVDCLIEYNNEAAGATFTNTLTNSSVFVSSEFSQDDDLPYKLFNIFN